MTLVFGVYSLEDHGLFVEILWTGPTTVLDVGFRFKGLGFRGYCRSPNNYQYASIGFLVIILRFLRVPDSDYSTKGLKALF